MALTGKNYIKKEEWKKFEKFLKSPMIDPNWNIKKLIQIVEAQN